MSVRRILTMFDRDVRDAIRDGRILVAIAIPVALAIFYIATAPEDGGPGGASLAAVLGVFSIAMLAAMIAFLVVPVLFVEDMSTGTLDALQLVARTPEIILAKLAVGLLYCVIGIAVTILVGGLAISSWLGFVGAALLMSIAMTGFGLMTGVALKDPSRVNTWSGVVLLPLLIPPFLVFGDVLERPWSYLADATPTGAGSLLVGAFVDPALDDRIVVPILTLVAWTAVGFGLLWRMLDRRES